METKGTLIFPKWLVTTPLEAPKQGFGIRVLEDKIASIATKEELLKNFPGDAVIEKPDQVLLPGFVDAHTHLVWCSGAWYSINKIALRIYAIS